jgi:hypothetical protein
MKIFVITPKRIGKLADIVSAMLANMAQQIQATLGEGVQHGLDVEKSHMRFFNSSASGSLMPCNE